MDVKIRHLVAKPGRARATRYYWEPSATLRALGWQGRRLRHPDGRPIAELEDAITAAEAINAQADESRTSATAPPAASGPPPGTIADVMRRYQASPQWTKLADKTQTDYAWCLRIVENWAGDTPARILTPGMVADFYERLQPSAPAKANAVIRVLRLMLSWARRKDLVAVNAAEKPGLVSTQPRLRVWTHEEEDAVIAAADVLELPSIGDAVTLALYTGQRQKDVLRLRRTQYRLGRIALRQTKRRAQVDVPAVPRFVDRLDAAVARLERWGVLPSDSAPLVVSEATGRGYLGDHFRDRFAEVRAAAALDVPSIVAKEPTPGDAAPAAANVPPIPTLWFSDLRDTAVTRLAEAECTIPMICSITGHAEKSAYDILKHYLSLTGDMADQAIARLIVSEERRRAEKAGARPAD